MKNNPSILIAPWQPAISIGEKVGIYQSIPYYSPEYQIWNQILSELDNLIDVDFYYTNNYYNASISINEIFQSGTDVLGDADYIDGNPYNGYFDIAINVAALYEDSIQNNINYYEYYKETATHELGHTLGLKHPFDNFGYLPADKNISSTETIMAYGYPANFTTLDLAALIEVNGIEDDWKNNETPVYRFYNNQSGGHFFTASTQEAEYVATKLFDNFSYEGTAFYAGGVNAVNSAEIYRFYNTKAGGHFFTASVAERDYVAKNMSSNYIYEGVAFKASPTKNEYSEEIYRFYNTKAGGHFFTASEGERDFVSTNMADSFIYEGIAFYA